MVMIKLKFTLKLKRSLIFALNVALLLLKSMITELKKLKIFPSKARKRSLSLKNIDMFVNVALNDSLNT